MITNALLVLFLSTFPVFANGQDLGRDDVRVMRDAIMETNTMEQAPEQPAGLIVALEFNDVYNTDGFHIDNSTNGRSVMAGLYYKISDVCYTMGVVNYGQNSVRGGNLDITELKVVTIYDVLTWKSVRFFIGGEVGNAWIDVPTDTEGALAAFQDAGLFGVRLRAHTGTIAVYVRASETKYYTKVYLGTAVTIPLVVAK